MDYIWQIIKINVIINILNQKVLANYFTKSAIWEYYITEGNACGIATHNR